MRYVPTNNQSSCTYVEVGELWMFADQFCDFTEVPHVDTTEKERHNLLKNIREISYRTIHKTSIMAK